MSNACNNEPTLRLVGVGKSYGAVRVLSDISFEIARGRVHALVGENGAGKSTLVKIITGIEPPDEGKVIFRSEPVRFDTPIEARGAGIAAVYQDPKLFPHLDIAENIFMGNFPRTRLGTVDRHSMAAGARSVLRRLGVELDLHALVATLSMAELQFVEISRALSTAVQLLILDEPTSALTPIEAERLFQIVRGLRDDNKSVLLITHRLEEVEAIADDVTVLRDGRHIVTQPAKELARATMVNLMVSREVAAHMFTDRKPAAPGVEILRIENLSRDGAFADVSFSLRAGEIVGMAGLVGAGRSEIAQSIFGMAPPSGGRILVNGREAEATSPERMLADGVAYLPEDRDRAGLIMNESVAENVTLPVVGRFARLGVIDRRRGRQIAVEAVRTYRIRANSIDQVVASLSGGNRQKVAFARWLATEPLVLMLDEPTHGVDVGSKAQIHQIIAELASSGMAVLLISSDLPEVLAMSDRILVVVEGRIAREFQRDEATQEAVMMAATGGAASSANKERAAPALTAALGRIALQLRVSGVLAFLVILCALFSIQAPQFLRIENLMAIASNAAILAVVAAAQAVVLLTRNLDVSVGAIMGLTGFLSASYAAHRGYAGLDLLLLALAIGSTLGAINGLIVAYGRVSPLVATLGTMSLYRGGTYIFAGGVDVAANQLPPRLLALANARVFDVPLVVFACAAVVILLALFLRLFPLGHRIYAIGSNPLAGVFFGLRSERVTLFAFTLCGLMSGFAGLLYAARVGTVTVVLGSGWELTSLAAAVLGGVSIAGGSGSVVGAALGALVLATIDNGLVLLDISEFWRMFVQGSAIVVAVAVDVFINGQFDRSLLKQRFGGRLA